MHPEAITSKQKEILKKLPIPSGFYLVGGTALALQIGHRISVDFDLFTSKELPENLFELLEKVFGDESIKIILSRSHQLTMQIQGVEVTYFRYPFTPIFPFIPYGRLKLLSIPEIAASKAHALGRRATFKDYIDLYFIIKEKHCALSEILKIAERKYKPSFEPRLFLEQLTYFDDVPSIRIKFLRGRISREEIKRYFEKTVSTVRL